MCCLQSPVFLMISGAAPVVSALTLSTAAVLSSDTTASVFTPAVPLLTATSRATVTPSLVPLPLSLCMNNVTC